MRKGGFFRSFLLRAGLGVLAWEIALIALLWILYHKVSSLQRFYFSDCLFFIGILLLTVASLGMMNRPFDVSNSPWGVPAMPVETSEQQKRYNLLAEYVEKRAFAFRLIAIGLLMVLVSAAFAYLVR